MPARVVYLGPEGAFCHEAAREYFSDRADLVPVASIPAVFEAVARGEGEWGVVPIENSIEGGVTFTQDTLLESALELCGEVMVDIEQCLLTNAPDPLRIQRVYSHPQGLAQCEGFLSSLKGVEIIATYDTAGSAKMIRDKELKDAAAIASARAAEVFKLESLAEGIQDFKENITRFIVISKGAADPETADKTMIVFTLPNSPGALFKALSVFALRDIDLTKLESRPVRGRAFEYLFYADIAVPRQDLQCTRALVHLAEFAKSMRTLGSYTSWKEKN